MKPFDLTMAPNDQAYAVESWGFIRDWIRAGVTAYTAWNMVLDTVGVGVDSTRTWPQDALLTVDTMTGALIVTPPIRSSGTCRSLSRPARRCSRRAAVTRLAFGNPDGSLVVVLYNGGTAKTTTVAIAGRTLQFAMPASGWATLVAR